LYISGSRTSDSAMLGDSSQPVGRPPTERHQAPQVACGEGSQQPADSKTKTARRLSVCLSRQRHGPEQVRGVDHEAAHPRRSAFLVLQRYTAISASATRNTGVSKQRACRLTQEHTGIWERFSGACLFKIPRWPTWPQAQLCTALLLRAGPVVESRQSCRCVHRAEPPLAMAMRQAAATSMRRVPF
jgi:hypothetical protein